MVILFSGINYADDYETAQRFQEGDTISAEVLNDILDRMELALKTTTFGMAIKEENREYIHQQRWCARIVQRVRN